MDADDIIDQLEQLLGTVSPSQLSRIKDIVGKPEETPTAPVDPFAAKRAAGAAAANASMKPAPAAAPKEPAPNSPEYFAAKRAAGAAALQANIKDKPAPSGPQKFGTRGIPGLGESAFYSKFLNMKI